MPDNKKRTKMQLTESSIYINLKRLRNLLYEAQFRMTTANRVVFGNTLMKYSAETISNFILAFTVGDKKLEYLELSLGYFAVLRDDLLFCIEQNIIQYRRRKKNDGDEDKTDEDFVNGRKVELFRLVAQIDNDICKWRASLAKGKSGTHNR